jgi:hypothetical protein
MKGRSNVQMTSVSMMMLWTTIVELNLSLVRRYSTTSQILSGLFPSNNIETRAVHDQQVPTYY